MQKLRSQSRLVICKPALLQIPILLALICFLGFSLVSPAAVIKVPQDYSTIQAAMDASADGDEIIVSPGTYYENIYFPGKNIILRSTDPTDPDVVASTIINGQRTGPVVRFWARAKPPCVLSGFTLTNGRATRGGGISAFGTPATIQNNTISGNKAEYGGGLYDCDGTIQNNTISGNSSYSNSEGGGLYNCDGSIKNNTISGNSARRGGALYNCNGMIQDNTISSNSAQWGGGLYDCDGAIQNNTIKRNRAHAYVCAGGGLNGCDGTIKNNRVLENYSNGIQNGVGGGFYNCNGTIQNNIISGNWVSGMYGTGAGLVGCDGTIQNNTIYGNTVSGTGQGGGLIGCNGTIRNCIIWQNTALSDAQLDGCSTPSYSCIQDWTGGGTGNISSDPQLVDPDNGDFHLKPTSLCIDAGCYVSDLTQDFDGDPRGYDSIAEPRGDGSDFDIGADEFIGTAYIAIYDFITDDEGWTTGTAEVFSAPEWVFEPGSLKLISQNNMNTFGFWVSPGNAIPVSEGYLYRARFTVSTDMAQPEIVPQIRLRVNSRNFQQADCITIDSNGDGGASPTPEGTTYDLYFVPPANDDFCMLAFDLLNFNPYDAAWAELCLESVLVERFRLDTLDGSTTITWSYDFETSQEFWFPGDGTFAFTDPEFIWDEGALHLRSATNTNTFGFWHSDGVDIIVEADRLYRGTFEVRTDETERSRVPQMRLRFNTANMQAARTLEISSSGDGANSPGTTNTTYDRLYFLPPANCVGKGLIVSFDILNFSPEDAPTATLILDRATIETLELPALP